MSWHECVGCRWLSSALNDKGNPRPFCRKYRKFYRGKFKQLHGTCFEEAVIQVNGNFTFPAHVASRESSPKAIFRKINEECMEAAWALLHGKMPEADMEVMDIYHACETYLRRRAASGVDLDSVRRQVIAKNDKRGYYGKGVAQ